MPWLAWTGSTSAGPCCQSCPRAPRKSLPSSLLTTLATVRMRDLPRRQASSQLSWQRCTQRCPGWQLARTLCTCLCTCWADGSISTLSPGRLVLSAPFLSIDAMAQALFGAMLLPSWLLRVLLTEHWDNGAWVPQAAQAGWDISIIHGTRDEIVPTWMGKALQQKVLDRGLKCNFVEVKTAGHNDLLGTPRNYAKLMGFATTMGGRGAAL
mmetsp:Transcript_75217/g.174390  ORF Transcript_75217/g.174390 Transcript_75217/m.174390 type:complete len:210 (+) Transcript_75217:214-843(+)